MTETDYDAFVRRIIDTLKRNTEFDKLLGEPIRYGDISEETYGNAFPVCFVTTARTPEISRNPMTPFADENTRAVERRELEFWVVLIVNESDPAESQKVLYDLTERVQKILVANRRLTDEDGDDPLCGSSQIYVQGRLERLRGRPVEAMTVRLRCTIYSAPDISEIDGDGN